jgi:hypothetical protein
MYELWKKGSGAKDEQGGGKSVEDHSEDEDNSEVERDK